MYLMDKYSLLFNVIKPFYKFTIKPKTIKKLAKSNFKRGVDTGIPDFPYFCTGPVNERFHITIKNIHD